MPQALHVPEKNAGPDAATWTVMVPAVFFTEHAPYRPCDPIKHNMLAINMERWHLQPSLFSVWHFIFLRESNFIKSIFFCYLLFFREERLNLKEKKTAGLTKRKCSQKIVTPPTRHRAANNIKKLFIRELVIFYNLVVLCINFPFKAHQRIHCLMRNDKTFYPNAGLKGKVLKKNAKKKTLFSLSGNFQGGKLSECATRLKLVCSLKFVRLLYFLAPNNME